MHTVVYIHGTGVREPAFSQTFRQVQSALVGRLGAANVIVEPCYWGGEFGATLAFGGASIPQTDKIRAVDKEPTDEEYLIALWAMLSENPYSELEILSLRSSVTRGDLVPGKQPPGENLDRLTKSLASGTIRADLNSKLAALVLERYFKAAIQQLISTPAYRTAIKTAVEPLTDYRRAIGRALFALTLQLSRVELGESSNFVPCNAAERDEIVSLIVAELGGQEAGVADWVKVNAGRLVANIGTGYFQNHRRGISSERLPFVADILLYQARPAPIRDFIRETILASSKRAQARGENEGQVTIIGHSLGGIAAVDTLVEQPVPCVNNMITVGSQASLFYELGALTSLPLRKNGGMLLPDHFPKSWLNIYDYRDFLSYLAAPIFGAAVQDERVDNKQPFPESHSAYWTNSRVWDLIVSRIKEPK